MFGMKPKTAKEILKLIEALPEDEQEKLYNAFVGEEEQAEESKEAPAADNAESAEQTETPAAEAPAEEVPAEAAETPTDGAPAAAEGTESPAASENAGQPETPVEAPTEPPQQAAETPENTPNVEAEQAASSEVPETPADGQAKDNKETFEALAARLNSLEERLAQMEQAQNDALNAEQNADFGLEQTVAPNKTGDDSRYNAVMQGYAGNNAKNYN